MMHAAVGWHVEMEFEEDDQHTRAAALLRLPDGSEVRSHGRASRHTTDNNQPRVGEEIAGARALNELALELLDKAHTEIDQNSGRTSHPIHV
ncbi:dsRBD fold-containing protein [Streptomyces sp. NPDC046831]|uniref:dsRBD fold-containing protein n=1 Tax=Streptomyces sp. NPDC046831 TaxID=3154805 RepID=UPI00340A9AB6